MFMNIKELLTFISGTFNVKRVENVLFYSLDHAYATGSSILTTIADVDAKDSAVQTDLSMDELCHLSDEIKHLQSKLNDTYSLLKEALEKLLLKRMNTYGF